MPAEFRLLRRGRGRHPDQAQPHRGPQDGLLRGRVDRDARAAPRIGQAVERLQTADYADLVVMPTCVLYRLLGKGIRVIGSA
jgi:hypothetical protein